MKKFTLFLMMLLLIVSAGCKKDKPEDVKDDKKTEAREDSKKDKKKKKNFKDGLDLKSIFNKDKNEGETQGNHEEESGDRDLENGNPQTGSFGIKSYEANEEIRIDLDHDGKEELLKLEQERISSEASENGEPVYDHFYLSINGERLEYIGESLYGGIKITDIDMNDNRVEIFVHIEDVGIVEIIKCFHYNGSELEEVYFTDDANSILFLSILEVREDRTIVFAGENYFSSYDQEQNMDKDLGQFSTEENYLLRDGILVYLGTPRYVKTSDTWRREAPYHVTVDGLDVYDKPMGNKIGEIGQGDVFYLQGVKKYNWQYSETLAEYRFFDAWADIKSDSGLSGWIEVPFGEFYDSDPQSEYSGVYHWN